MDSDVRQEILNEWMAALEAALRGDSGRHIDVRHEGCTEAPEPAGMLWWACPGAGGTKVWVGASAAAWQTVGTMVAEARGAEGPVDARRLYLELLSASFQAQGEPAANAPACPPYEIVEIAAPTPVRLLVGIEAAAAEQPEQKAAETASTLDVLLDIDLPVSLRFGRARMTLGDILRLGSGSVVELDRGIGEPIEVIVNGRAVATGKVVTVRGNFGVQVTHITSRRERLGTTLDQFA